MIVRIVMWGAGDFWGNFCGAGRWREHRFHHVMEYRAYLCYGTIKEEINRVSIAVSYILRPIQDIHWFKFS